MQKSSVRRLRLVAAMAAAALLLSAFPAFATEEAEGASFDAAAFEAENVEAGKFTVTVQSADDVAWSTAAAVTQQDFNQVAPRVFVVEGDVELAQVVATQRGVVAVEPMPEHTFHLVPDDELYEAQWYHQDTNIEDAWDITTGSSETTSVIVDSGANAEHPDLADRVTEQLTAHEGQVEAGSSPNNNITNDIHGSAVAGAFGALGNDGYGIAGVDWASDIVDINVATPTGLNSQGILASITHAAEIGADLVNLSLGTEDPVACDEAFQATIDNALAAGTVVVASSGNQQQEYPDDEIGYSPGNCDGVLTVGATGPGAEIADYSSQHPYVDVSAPGGTNEDPFVTTGNVAISDEFIGVTGTSFSAPYVSGVVSLMKAVNPDLSPAEVYDLITSTAVHPDGEERDDVHGHGFIDVFAAVEAAAPEPADPRRIYDGSNDTNPVDQAVAASQHTFHENWMATHAVIAQDGDYADALAGSTLTMGQAPILFTGTEGGLPDATAEELQRVLPDGGDVYVLGGVEAVGDENVTELEELGYDVERISGPSRAETAEAVADKVVELAEDVEGVVLAKAFDWPDAVTAGSVGVNFDYPVLVTGYGEDQVDELHEAAARALEALDPEYLITVGGTSAIGEEAEREAADIGDVPEENITRLGGGSRLETAIEVGQYLIDYYSEEEADVDPVFQAYGVNVRSDDGWAHVLSTTASITPSVSPQWGVYVPFEGDDGGRYLDDDTAHVREWVQGNDWNAAWGVGGTDVLADEPFEAFFEDANPDWVPED